MRSRIFGLTGPALIAAKKAVSWPPDNCAWHADHVVPVTEGGDSSLRNLRTLCTIGGSKDGCHGRVTRELRARMARRPSATRAAARNRRREARHG